MSYKRKLAKRDANHAEIVKALEACGCTVLDLSAVGKGCPDIAVGRLGTTYLLEIKSGSRAKHVHKDQEHQLEWHARWRGGPVKVVASVIEALQAVSIRPS